MVHRATKQAVSRVFIFGIVLAQCLTVPMLVAAEYHGTVKSDGLPIPGAVVTATQGEKKLTTTTDDQGAYSFPDLEDGAWTITVEMLGFDKISRPVTISPAASTADLDLRLSPLQSVKPESAAAPDKERNATATPGAPAKESAPSQNSAAANPPNSGGRARAAQTGGAGRTFQRLDVNASGDAGALPGETAGSENDLTSGNLSQNAAEAMVVNGSVSNGVNAPQQNDWAPFSRGPGGDFGPGGPVVPVDQAARVVLADLEESAVRAGAASVVLAVQVGPVDASAVVEVPAVVVAGRAQRARTVARPLETRAGVAGSSTATSR